MDLIGLFVNFVFLLCSFPLGYFGGRAYALAQHRLLQALELRLSDCEARLIKQAKVYAGNLSARSRSVDDELLEMAQRTVEAGKTREPVSPFYFPEAR